MQVINKKNKLSNKIETEKELKKSIGFVPTMGALHQGHISLIEKARAKCDVIVCSIFINPTQFNNSNDLSNYPKSLKQDLNLLELHQCDYVFTPEYDELYENSSGLLDINLKGLDGVMEGEFRPGHFLGMITVVKKFFDIINPDYAFFGEKDFQQLAIIKYMVDLFHLPIQIIACETVREHDGLAMSSRNALLSEDERKAAPLIYQTLSQVKTMLESMSVNECKETTLNAINNNNNLGVEYFEIVNAKTLQPITNYSKDKQCRACIAVYAGNIRLIDNISL